MLTELREKSQSFGVYVVFGMLIVVFIFFFGPQSEGCQPSSGPRVDVNSWAFEVGGEEVSQREVEISVRRQALFDPDFDDDPAALMALRRQTAMQVAEQAVVEHKARQMGLAIGEDALSRYILSDENPDYPLFTDQDGNFDAEMYRARLTQQFGATSDAYRRAKRREVLVDRYLAFLAGQVQVSEAEVREAFDRARRTWNLEYVELDPAVYAIDVGDKTAADGVAYAKANPEEVEKYYTDNKQAYDRGREVKIRRVLVRKPKDADDAAVAEAKAKAEALRAEAAAAGADFEAIAREKSEGYYKSFGGDMGWQREDNTSESDYAVYAKLDEGQVSEVVESPIGFWFVKAEDVKPAVEKTLDEARDEIGLILAKQNALLTASRERAGEIITAVKGGGSLEEAAQAAVPAIPVEEAPPAPVEGEENDAEEGIEGAEEVVPEPEDGTSEPPPSRVKTTGPFSADRPQWDRIPGIGMSPELAGKLDALTADKPLIEEPVEVDGKLYVVRLETRTEPDDAAYQSERDTFARRLRDQRAAQMLGNWQAVLFGPVRQREVFRRFSGGALLDVIEEAFARNEVKINTDAYPAVQPPASPAGQ